MAQAMGSKSAAVMLLDPMNAPEPSSETGPGSHFGSTFAPAQTGSSQSPKRDSLNSNNPFREASGSQRSSRSTPPSKNAVISTERPISRGSPRERFPDYRAEAFSEHGGSRSRSGSAGYKQSPPSYDDATSPNNSPTHRHRRRTSSLRERYPGDDSIHPLDVIRRDSKKAHRSPHLKKHHMPGPDTIDRLDPSIGGRAYHHEGPYDAALLARNTSYKNSPVAALKTTNDEALKATPEENIKDAIERHRPLDGVAIVPPGQPDRFGRVYNYEEGADLMHEDNNEGPGYKRWPGKDYSPDDLKGQSEPTFSLDRALRAHRITDSGIEMNEGTHLGKGSKYAGAVDGRDPVDIAGDDGKYVDMELAHTHDNDARAKRSNSLRDGLKKRIGSLRKKNNAE